jgi:hypothetical protein
LQLAQDRDVVAVQCAAVLGTGRRAADDRRIGGGRRPRRGLARAGADGLALRPCNPIFAVFGLLGVI